MFDTLVIILESTFRLSSPLLLACLAGLFAERSGVFDIGLEGKMLAAAFAGAAAAIAWGDPWLAVFFACLVSVIFSMIHGVACITFRGNQIVSGVAINFLAAGLTAVIGNALYHMGGRSPSLPASARFLEQPVLFAESVAAVPVLGPLWGTFFNHNVLTYVAFLAVPVTWFVLYRSRFGLRLRAVGENPAAVDTAGISVTLLRYQALICCGILCGLSGATLSMALGAGFGVNMSSGRGFIALAALIFAKWRPIQAMFACLLFGLLDAAAIQLQGKSLPGFGEVPVQLIQSLPYILTVVLLAGFIGKAIPPKAGGRPYVKER